MRFIYPKTGYPKTPKGKRRVERNIYGNVNGYVGTKRFWEFGAAWAGYAEDAAAQWLAGKDLQQIYEGE